jgi:hypothetical protein
MISRNYREEDYKDLQKWYNHYATGEWVCPPVEILPTDTGLVVEYEGEKICAGFIYLTNSKIAALEFTIANYDTNKEIRRHAITLLLTKLIELAKNKGYKFIFSSTNNAGLAIRFRKLGFVRTDQVYNYLKVL